MAFTRTGTPNHDTLAGVSANDHHTPTVAGDLNLADLAERLHASLTSVGVGDHHTATVAGDLSLAALAERLHASLTSVGVDDHHTEAHTILSHSDGGDSAKIAVGSYTGDGATSQAITGIGFQVRYVLINVVEATAGNAYGADEIVWTTETTIDDNAAGATVSLNGANGWFMRQDSINALGTDGFTVDDQGSDRNPNKNSESYNFIAFGVEL